MPVVLPPVVTVTVGASLPLELVFERADDLSLDMLNVRLCVVETLECLVRVSAGGDNCWELDLGEYKLRDWELPGIGTG